MIDIGTIGSKPCEVELNNILIKLNDAKTTNKVMRIYQDAKDGLKILDNSNLKDIDESFFFSVVNMFREKTFKFQYFARNL